MESYTKGLFCYRSRYKACADHSFSTGRVLYPFFILFCFRFNDSPVQPLDLKAASKNDVPREMSTLGHFISTHKECPFCVNSCTRFFCCMLQVRFICIYLHIYMLRGFHRPKLIIKMMWLVMWKLYLMSLCWSIKTASTMSRYMWKHWGDIKHKSSHCHSWASSDVGTVSSIIFIYLKSSRSTQTWKCRLPLMAKRVLYPECGHCEFLVFLN